MSIRNPEGINLKRYPPPLGWVVATDEDLADPKHPKRGWKIFWDGLWRPCSGRNTFHRGWTYLRPDADGVRLKTEYGPIRAWHGKGWPT